jgi:hypothetical protein
MGTHPSTNAIENKIRIKISIVFFCERKMREVKGDEVFILLIYIRETGLAQSTGKNSKIFY